MGMKYGLCGVLAVVAPLAACDMEAGTRHRAVRVPEPTFMETRTTLGEEGTLKLARSLQKSGAHSEAFSVLASAHARFPDSHAVLSAYGRQAAIMRRDRLALQLLQRAIEADPEDWRAHSAYAVVAERQGYNEEARAAFARARSTSGANTASLNNLGMSYLLQGHAGDAAGIFRQALMAPNIDKTHILLVKRNLAVALAVQGDFEKADRLAGYSLPRELHDAEAVEIAKFMGVAEPVASVPGPKPRLADASPVVPKFAR